MAGEPDEEEEFIEMVGGITREQAADLATSIVVGAATGGAAGASTAALDGGVGAAAGVGAGIAGALVKRFVRSPDQAFEAARQETIAEYAHRVPAIEARVERLGDLLRERYEAHFDGRINGVHQEILQLVAAGTLSIDQVEHSQAFADTLMRSCRAALDALSPAAVPMVARLVCLPVNRFFRAAARVVVELDATELAELRGLIAAAAHALPAYLSTVVQPESDDPGHVGQAARENELRRTLSKLTLRGRSQIVPEDPNMEWWPLDVLVTTSIDTESPVFALLVDEHLASDPYPRPEPGGGVHECATMQLATVLNLHFILSGERIVDPRCTDEPR